MRVSGSLREWRGRQDHGHSRSSKRSVRVASCEGSGIPCAGTYTLNISLDSGTSSARLAQSSDLARCPRLPRWRPVERGAVDDDRDRHVRPCLRLRVAWTRSVGGVPRVDVGLRLRPVHEAVDPLVVQADVGIGADDVRVVIGQTGRRPSMVVPAKGRGREDAGQLVRHLDTGHGGELLG